MVVDTKSNLPENDIGKLIDDIQDQLKESKNHFNGYLMSSDCKDIADDALDVLKGLIQSNL